MVLVGETGSGKTTQVRKICDELVSLSEKELFVDVTILFLSFAGLMLVRRRRRQANIKPALVSSEYFKS